MSVRKREWTSPRGEAKSAWVVDYTDTNGKRRLKTFQRKKEADAFSATASVEVREGSHVADRATVTVAAAAKLWLARCERAGLERTTVSNYEARARLHILPFIGSLRLSALTIPLLRDMEDELLRAGRSSSMVKETMVALSGLLADAQERGLIGRNVVKDMRGRRRGSAERQEKRHKRKLKVGVDIPTPEEVKAILAAATGRWRPLLLVAVFCGLRASELRGLRWADVDLEKGRIRVHQRADAYNAIGSPKSATSERTIPLPPIAVRELRVWKLACPIGDLDLVFPNTIGRVETHSNILQRGLQPTLIRAGVTVETGGRDERGLPILKAKYPGMHSLRHFFASWCINRRADGGLELPPKTVQERMGHSTIVLTMDRYSHLFPTHDDGTELEHASAWLAT